MTIIFAPYIRISQRAQRVDERELKNSVMAQIWLHATYGAERGWRLGPCFIDYGSVLGERPALQMMARSVRMEPKPFDVLLVSQEDRLHRDAVEIVRFKRVLALHQIDLHMMDRPPTSQSIEEENSA